VLAQKRRANASARDTHPMCFSERVWIWLIAKGLSFLATPKSLQEYVSNGVRSFCGRKVAKLNRSHSHTRGATQIVIKAKGLREKQFVRR